jgi:hypothetical protein
MALHTLAIASHQLEFQLPVNSPITDIEWEAGGKNVIPLGCRVGAGGACLIKVSGATTADVDHISTDLGMFTMESKVISREWLLAHPIDECPPPQPDKTRPPFPSFSAARARSAQRWPLGLDRED